MFWVWVAMVWKRIGWLWCLSMEHGTYTWHEWPMHAWNGGCTWYGYLLPIRQEGMAPKLSKWRLKGMWRHPWKVTIKQKASSLGAWERGLSLWLPKSTKAKRGTLKEAATLNISLPPLGDQVAKLPRATSFQSDPPPLQCYLGLSPFLFPQVWFIQKLKKISYLPLVHVKRRGGKND